MNDDQLRRALEEGLDPSSDEARELLGSVEAQEELRDCQRLVAGLERAGDLQRSDLHGVTSEEVPVWIEQFVGQRVAERGKQRTVRSRRRLWIPALMAAAALLMLISLWPTREPEAPTRTILGSSFTALEPSGPCAEFSGFSWEYDGPAHGYFVVQVFSVDSSTDRALLESPRLTESLWSLSPREIALLPERIEWEVRAFDGSTRLIGSRSASAFLSP